MKAIVRFEYGSPDVLQLQDIDKPIVKSRGAPWVVVAILLALQA